jgi:hypothetical protein
MAQDALSAIEYDGRPPAYILADSDAAGERMALSAARASLRVVETVRVQVSDRDFSRAPGLAALIELDGSGSDPAPLLAWSRDQIERGARPIVFSCAPVLIDPVFAALGDLPLPLLCAASEAERILVLAGAARQPSRLDDIGRDKGAAILQQLTEDVSRIAAILSSLSEEEARSAGDRHDEDSETGEDALDAQYIRAIIRARRLRDQFFRNGLFADPAWDMLLDLMAARLEGNRVAVSSLCIAAAVPATTALRWIKALTDRGLLVRSADPNDGRRVYIELSDETARTMSACLRAARRISPSPI